MAESTWSIHIRYLADSTITRVRVVPTGELVRGGPHPSVPLQPGDHILGPVADRATAERVRLAVVREIEHGGRWRAGALPRLQRGLGLGIDTWQGQDLPGEDTTAP